MPCIRSSYLGVVKELKIVLHLPSKLQSIERIPRLSTLWHLKNFNGSRRLAHRLVGLSARLWSLPRKILGRHLMKQRILLVAYPKPIKQHEILHPCRQLHHRCRQQMWLESCHELLASRWRKQYRQPGRGLQKRRSPMSSRMPKPTKMWRTIPASRWKTQNHHLQRCLQKLRSDIHPLISTPAKYGPSIAVSVSIIVTYSIFATDFDVS